MALNYGFFNSVNGDRRYDARWFAKYFASFIGNGVFPNPSNGMQVVEGENMTIIIKPGQGWINGYYADNDTDYALTLDNADGLLKRIDRIVLRWNQIERVIEFAVKKGAFASNPVTPTLQRDGDYYELVLADVLISNGTTQITQANITDTRLNTELCGIVHGTVNQVDTTTLFNQYQSWINQQKNKYANDFENWSFLKREEFENWLDELNALIDGDAVANLLSLINSLKAKVGDTSQLLTNNKNSTVAAINELFTNANNLKSDWASVVGADLLPTDTSTVLKSKTQNIKNTFASNLNAKGQ